MIENYIPNFYKKKFSGNFHKNTVYESAGGQPCRLISDSYEAGLYVRNVVNFSCIMEEER